MHLERCMSLIQKYKDWFYITVLTRLLGDCSSVLDVGCGTQSPLTYIPKKFASTGVDIYAPSITISRNKMIHDEYKIADIRSLDKLYPPANFDGVIALDVIEHLSKNEAVKLIQSMEKIARRIVILMTPNGFYCQNPYHGNPYQRHKSGWKVDEFYTLNYHVLGIRGIKYLRGEFASIKYKPWFMWATLSFLSEPIVSFFPRLSYQCIAYKKLK